MVYTAGMVWLLAWQQPLSSQTTYGPGSFWIDKLTLRGEQLVSVSIPDHSGLITGMKLYTALMLGLAYASEGTVKPGSTLC